MPRHTSKSATRRNLLKALALVVPQGSWVPAAAAQARGPASAVAHKSIPSSGEKTPVVGLGSWITFNVGSDPVARDACAEVMRAFFETGGRMIDSSPMYGSSQPVIGQGLARLGGKAPVFSADKVWIGSRGRGPAQIEASRRHWGVSSFDLLQVQNLLAWEEHLPLLFGM